jgi:hypothetical protein
MMQPASFSLNQVGQPAFDLKNKKVIKEDQGKDNLEKKMLAASTTNFFR